MAKPKLPTSGFFGNFSSESNDNVEDINDEVEDQVEDEEEEQVDTDDEEISDEEEVLEEDKEDEEEQESDDDSDPFIDTINHLAEKGLLVYDEDKEYEEEGEELLETVFNETLEKRFQEEYIDTIPEDYRSILDHLKTGGKLEDWVDAVKPTDFDSINLEDEDNQKQLIEDHLALTGMDDEDIKERIQELEDLGTLEKNAKTAIKYLKKNEEGKVKAYEQELAQTIKAQEEQQAKALDEFKKTVLSTEDIKGFKLKDKAQRQELLDYITKPTNSKGESKYVQETKDIDTQLALAYMAMKKFTFKDLEKAVQTKAVSGLRKSLSKISDVNAKGNGGRTVRDVTPSKKIPKGPWG